MAPELDPDTARIGSFVVVVLIAFAAPRWYGSKCPAPLNESVRNLHFRRREDGGVADAIVPGAVACKFLLPEPGLRAPPVPQSQHSQ